MRNLRFRLRNVSCRLRNVGFTRGVVELGLDAVLVQENDCQRHHQPMREVQVAAEVARLRRQVRVATNSLAGEEQAEDEPAARKKQHHAHVRQRRAHIRQVAQAVWLRRFQFTPL